MSKTIFICFRRIPKENTIEKDLRHICDKLAPDNIIPNKPFIRFKDTIAFGIMNPNSILKIKGNSLILGYLMDYVAHWHVPGTKFPDGSYAIFRDNIDYFEIVSDPVASRTIWYYMDENKFVASTTQRAIIMFIGSYQFDERIIPWMLSSGTLGPTFSWDKRLNRLPIDSSVILDKKSWSISMKSNPIEFKTVNGSNKEHEKRLKDSLTSTFVSLKLDYSHWALPLSGGYDSRAILLLLLKNNTIQNLKTITWGLEQSLKIKNNDACIAKKLATYANVSHNYYLIDDSKEPVEKIINRFILLGEGRIDHLSGYMDGFSLWKDLFNCGIQGILRGDQSLSSRQVSSSSEVRLKVGCGLFSDYRNLGDCNRYSFSIQEFPENLKKRKHETLLKWRDRLYQEYRIPTILGALSDLKLSYVEQVNPLLSRQILAEVRKTPDRLRNKKIVFKRIVNSLSPTINFATTDAIYTNRELLKKQPIVDLLQNELSSNYAKSFFPKELLHEVLHGIRLRDKTNKNNNHFSSLRYSIIKRMPGFIKSVLRNSFTTTRLDYNVLAFRIVIIAKMNRVLIADCKRIGELADTE